ncbi:unnamed protein product [Protopolystoma xenopodis]|uniref:Uncharacterized protein n=1 Tax=Protopolystoma xenopodis TaxID=117903 RepID=A0A3S5CQ94_9PLAT|nr:unnamed protein product [Protopolystoma xenopodis]
MLENMASEFMKTSVSSQFNKASHSTESPAHGPFAADAVRRPTSFVFGIEERITGLAALLKIFEVSSSTRHACIHSSHEHMPSIPQLGFTPGERMPIFALSCTFLSNTA